AVTLKNNYFRGFKLPDFEDLYWEGGGMSGNPDLKPEDGWGADLGGSYRYKAFAADGTVFAQWTADSIHWSNTRGTWRPENVGKAAFFGCDAAVRLPLGAAALSLSYQYLRSYLLSYGYTWASERRIPYMPAHTVGGSVEIPWNAGSRAAKGSALVSAHYESLRYADPRNISELPPYFLLSVTLNQNVGEHWTAFAAAHNALNASYESFDGYPMPGVTLTVGARMNFAGLKQQSAKAA
ncbi:TonB-dependent receptor domain-containing protein, partial [Treponema endosymbiont of Eucomonympha sp.]|uniref:TonB-dependent receptor domain-containing protein n=1 Tax=Treponema endosymbiont of Eucomonympha sp. TaxID=1580831 RepID=UPI000B2B59AB